jgi:O-antigen/teichoic acid export membrane protein
MTLATRSGAADAEESPHRPRSGAVNAGVWILVGLGTMQVLRVASNIVLTRLLFAEAFGLMQLVTAVMVGLHLFTDVGIGPSVLQSPHGDDPDFLDTAFTVQVVRGTIICLIGLGVAYPFSRYYHEPQLFLLLIGANLSSLISSLQSTKWFTASRRLALRRLTMIEVGVQVVSLAFTLVAVYFSRSVFALLAGTLVGDVLRAIASHALLAGHRDRLRVARPHLRGMLRFGRWIFLSTMLSFVVGQADRLVFGKLVPIAMLGVYGIAANVAGMAPQTVGTLVDRLIFPMLAKVHNEEDRLGQAFVRARRPVLALAGLALAGFIGGGQAAVRLMYDPRYHGAGWIVQVLSVGAWFSTLDLINTRGLLARGDSHWLAASSLGKLGGMLMLIPAGYVAFGFRGAVVGYAASDLGRYVVSCWAMRRKGMLALGDDTRYGALMFLAAALAYGAVALVGLSLTGNTVVAALTVFLVVVTVYSPILRGLLRDLRAIRAASRGGIAPALPGVAPTAEA